MRLVRHLRVLVHVSLLACAGCASESDDGAAPRVLAGGPAGDAGDAGDSNDPRHGDPSADAGAPTVTGDAACVGKAPSASYLQKISELPDYTQTDPAYGGLPGAGNYHCGPTAVSNSLMWLASHGYAGLVPATTDRKKDQHDLIATLGSQSYFQTSLDTYGTPPAQLLGGLKKYLTDKSVGYASLRWQGWSPLPIAPEFDTGVATPSLDWIKRGVEGTSSAWLLLAKGSYDAQADVHDITGGHWVTVAGHGSDGSVADPNLLVIHDPWTGGSASELVRLERLSSGTIKVDSPALPAPITHPAADLYRFGGASSDVVLLLGAVVLEMTCEP